MKLGDILTNQQGKQLTLIKWLPNAGFTVKGKWLCRNKGITCQLNEAELTARGYKVFN